MYSFGCNQLLYLCNFNFGTIGFIKFKNIPKLSTFLLTLVHAYNTSTHIQVCMYSDLGVQVCMYIVIDMIMSLVLHVESCGLGTVSANAVRKIRKVR